MNDIRRKIGCFEAVCWGFRARDEQCVKLLRLTRAIFHGYTAEMHKIARTLLDLLY